jgi:hypothetical protein
MRGVDVWHVEDFGKPLRGETGIPIVAVEELVFEPVLLDEAERPFRPFGEVADHVFLVDEVTVTAGDSNHADAVVDDIDFGLVLKTPGPDVHLETELGELLGEFEDINDLATGVGLPQRGFGSDITVGGNHTDARERRLRENEGHSWTGFCRRRL